MEAEARLWLVRHAAVAGPAGLIHDDDAPADLGNVALLEAVRRSLPKDASSFASPSRRTMDTAERLGLVPNPVANFSEQDFGDWTGRRHDELASSGGEAYAAFWTAPAAARPPRGESFEDQIARVREGLRCIEGDAILIVHSGTIRAALCIALNIAAEAGLRFVIDPLSITRIDRVAGGWRVIWVNRIAN